MNGIIGIEQLKITCFIGVNAEEHHQQQDIFVDLKIRTNFTECTRSDHIVDTINYVILAEMCTQLANAKKFNLLEAYAYSIVEMLFKEFDITWALVKVSKPLALSNAKAATVEIQKSKDD